MRTQTAGNRVSFNCERQNSYSPRNLGQYSTRKRISIMKEKKKKEKNSDAIRIRKLVSSDVVPSRIGVRCFTIDKTHSTKCGLGQVRLDYLETPYAKKERRKKKGKPRNGRQGGRDRKQRSPDVLTPVAAGQSHFSFFARSPAAMHRVH